MKYLLTSFILLCVSPSIAFAYLDPGSGSLLLSSFVAFFASMLFFVKNIFYKIISFGTYTPLTSVKEMGGGGSHSNLVFYSEGPQYYGTFKPILDALDSLKHPYTYYTSSKNDPALQRLKFDNSLKNGKFMYIGEGNKAYSLLNKLRTDILVLTTPGLDVLHIRRNRGVAHYCHIVHSLSPMTYRVFGIDYFDSVLVANAAQADFVRNIESAHNVKRKHIAITGSTYLDDLFIQTQSLQSHTQDSTTRTILISPSWGKETLLSKYGLELLLPLAKSSYKIIIRPHPQSYISPDERRNIQSLQEALEDYKNVSWDQGTPNVHAFAKADMMISDFSSVIFDFVCLQGKPVLTIDNDMDLSGYDMADISRDSIWTFNVLDKIGRRISQEHFSNLQQICEDIFNSYCDNISTNAHEKLKMYLQETKEFLWQFPGNAGVQSAMEILKIEREIVEAKLKPQMSLVARLRELDDILIKGQQC